MAALSFDWLVQELVSSHQRDVQAILKLREENCFLRDRLGLNEVSYHPRFSEAGSIYRLQSSASCSHTNVASTDEQSAFGSEVPIRVLSRCTNSSQVESGFLPSRDKTNDSSGTCAATERLAPLVVAAGEAATATSALAGSEPQLPAPVRRPPAIALSDVQPQLSVAPAGHSSAEPGFRLQHCADPPAAPQQARTSDASAHQRKLSVISEGARLSGSDEVVCGSCLPRCQPRLAYSVRLTRQSDWWRRDASVPASSAGSRAITPNLAEPVGSSSCNNAGEAGVPHRQDAAAAALERCCAEENVAVADVHEEPNAEGNAKPPQRRARLDVPSTASDQEEAPSPPRATSPEAADPRAHSEPACKTHPERACSPEERCLTYPVVKADRRSHILSEEMPELWGEWKAPAPRQVILRTPTRGLLVDQSCQSLTGVSERGCLRAVILHPTCWTRLCWDFGSSIVVCYDMVTIPMVFAFSIGDGETWLLTMNWLTIVFWTIDIPISYLTGFHSEGIVEMRPRFIAHHYLRTWFPFDMSVTAMDWLFLLMYAWRDSGEMGLARASKSGRIFRILRVVRILRFFRLQRTVSEFLEKLNSESARALFNVWLAVMLILMVNHYMACGWYWLGERSIAIGHPSWINSPPHDNDLVLLKNLHPGNWVKVYCYVTALHWSLTQFTPASMEIRGYNVFERVYTIFALFFALVTFSSFLGSITASMTQLRKAKSESAKVQSSLRRYFLRNKVSSELSQCIWTFLKENHFAHQTRTHKSELAVLSMLPLSLQKRLHQELYGPYLTQAPFFFHYADLSAEGFVEVCSRTVTESCITYSEVLFQMGKVAEKVFFVISGTMRYEHSEERLQDSLGPGAWACEPVLWLKWMHRASMIAETSCELIEVNAKTFREIMTSYRHALPFVKAYAAHFASMMRHATDELWCTDLWTDGRKLDQVAWLAWKETYAVSREAGEAPMKLRSRSSHYKRHSVRRASLQQTTLMRQLSEEGPLQIPVQARRGRGASKHA